MKPLASIPQFAEATSEITGLAAALGKVNGRIHEIESELRTASDVAEDIDAAHVDAAMRFAESGTVESIGNRPQDLRDEHVSLRIQREKVQAAMARLQQNRETVAGELSAQVNLDQAAVHKKIVARALQKLIEFDAIVMEEIQLVRSIEQAGYTARFTEYAQWPYVGTLSMKSSEAAIWSRVKELKAYVG